MINGLIDPFKRKADQYFSCDGQKELPGDSLKRKKEGEDKDTVACDVKRGLGSADVLRGGSALAWKGVS